MINCGTIETQTLGMKFSQVVIPAHPLNYHGLPRGPGRRDTIPQRVFLATDLIFELSVVR